MNDATDKTEDLLIADLGDPPYDRRLTDKILAAFNHALALGYPEIAERLYVALEIAEREGVKKFGERRGVTVLDLAGLWRAFIGARDHYQKMLSDPGAGADRRADALARMRERWRLWTNFAEGTKKKA